MNTVIVLFWLLISPTGDGTLVIQHEPSIEQCQKDGNAMAEASAKQKEAGEIKAFYGACYPLDLSNTDKRGSI